MNYDLLKLLKDNTGYTSGEEISKIFGVTRAFVWKQINELKAKGYVIEGVSKKGYKLISSPDLLNPIQIKDNLSSNFLGSEIKYFSSLVSTNQMAKDLAFDSVDGTIVVSEEQKGGTGRFGRSWISPKGGLWFSLILKPKLEPIYASKITLIAAASLILVLRRNNFDALIKWPNDIYINNKKVCGILTEMKCDMDIINYLVVGIGLNANISYDSFTDETKETAISLNIVKGEDVDRGEILSSFIKEFENLYLNYIKTLDISKVLEISRKHSILLNKKAYHITSRGKELVTCLEVDDQGELIVEDSNGEIKSVLSGEISFKI